MRPALAAGGVARAAAAAKVDFSRSRGEYPDALSADAIDARTLTSETRDLLALQPKDRPSTLAARKWNA